ncbi:hypothetical protein D3C87_2037620 [compost metagenome]
MVVIFDILLAVLRLAHDDFTDPPVKEPKCDKDKGELHISRHRSRHKKRKRNESRQVSTHKLKPDAEQGFTGANQRVKDI